MKKINFSLLFLCLSFSLFAQVIDKPAIKVEYDSKDIISEKELDHRLEQQKNLAKIYRQNPDLIQKKDIAKMIVQEKLLLQAAKSHKITVEDYQIDSQIRQQREMISKQIGREVTDNEFDQFLAQYGMSLSDIKENIRRTSTIQQFVNSEKADFIKNYKQPTEADIARYFKLQREAGRLTKPTYVELSHIFFSTQGKRYDEMKEIHQKAESVLDKIKKGADFYEMVQKYSEDEENKSKKGLMGWATIQDPRFLQLFGEDACLEIVALNKGDVSGVIESPMGFHLLKIVDKEPGGIPQLTDKVNPQINQTWHDYIKQLLLNETAQRAFMEAMEQLANEIKEDAIITYYNKELE